MPNILHTLPSPKVILFDWHGTLVNTLEPMYQAIEDMLPRLEELDLVKYLIADDQARTEEDKKLLRYIRIFRHLHPRVLAEQRISRTDIFDVLFGDNETAQQIAHEAYNNCYRKYCGQVTPIQDSVYNYLIYFIKSGIRLGIVTNRNRVFLANELRQVDSGHWQCLFDISVCGNEAKRHKPAPDGILQALNALGISPDQQVWYVGDSATDMVTAAKANVTSIFYNSALWAPDWFERMFSETDRDQHKPHAIVNDFDHLVDLVEASTEYAAGSKALFVQRPSRLPPREPPRPRDEPDWHPAVAKLAAPRVILFDWHATLVDTLDAMYHAVDDMLKELRETGLLEHIVPSDDCKSYEDMKLVDYVRKNLSLHPAIKLDRKISRTDIFEVLFGDNEAAKKTAHDCFTKHYRKYYGTALPFEPRVRDVLEGLRSLGLIIGVITNRDREFFLHELNAVDETGWSELFQTHVCGDDTMRRKPHPDQIYKAADNLQCQLGPEVWYVGDSTTDVIAAKSAGITAVFFNGALWDQPWLNKIFPGTERYPHKPDAVVNDFSEFWAMLLACRKNKPTEKESI